MRDRWAEGEGWVNLEHDVVPAAGSLAQLEQCPEEWCAFGYWDGHDLSRGATLGLTKLGAGLIDALPGVWEEAPDRHWRALDVRLYAVALAEGLTVHQHYPPASNGTDDGRGRLRGGVYAL